MKLSPTPKGKWTRPPIKERFREKYECTIENKLYPKILPNLNELALSFLNFIVDKHNEGEEEVKSGKILEHLKTEYGIKKDYFQKIRQQLIKDNVLARGSKESYYYIPHEIRNIYKIIFTEQEKIKIFNLKPVFYHYITSFLLQIPKESFSIENIIVLMKELGNKGFLPLEKGIYYFDEKKRDKVKELTFYYESLMFAYYLLINIEYFDEDKESFYFILKSDLHITEKHTLFDEVINHFSKQKNKTKLYKKWASSITFTHNFDIFWYLYYILDAKLVELYEFLKR